MRTKQLFLVLVLAVAVAGFGFAAGQGDGGAAEMVEIEFMHSKSHLGEQYRGLADEFEKVNPNIKVNDEVLGGVSSRGQHECRPVPGIINSFRDRIERLILCSPLNIRIGRIHIDPVRVMRYTYFIIAIYIIVFYQHMHLTTYVRCAR